MLRLQRAKKRLESEVGINGLQIASGADAALWLIRAPERTWGRWTLVLVGPEFIFKSMSANKGKLVFDGRKNFNQILRYDAIVQVRDCRKEQNRARHSSCFYIHALMHE